MDADSTSRRRSHDDILSAFRRGEAQILVGTQMIAKGLDFPNVTLVGVLNADSSLNMPDFRAAERTYQLIAQVAGRAGRAELPGEVVVQSFEPSSPAIVAASCGDYAGFAARELKDRETGFFPPYCHLALVSLKSQDLNLVAKWSDMYSKSFMAFAKRNPSLGLVVSEAVPSALEKADGWYRWQIVLRSPGARAIVMAWRTISAHRPPPRALVFALDMDAHNLA
jgi:primosomal protein N' (replication factor Y)